MRSRLPERLLTNRARYLDQQNFATNFAFFRDADGLSTRLVIGELLGAAMARGTVRLWLRLFDADGALLATWEQECLPGRAVSPSTAARCGRASVCRNSPASCSSTRSAYPGTMW